MGNIIESVLILPTFQDKPVLSEVPEANNPNKDTDSLLGEMERSVNELSTFYMYCRPLADQVIHDFLWEIERGSREDPLRYFKILEHTSKVILDSIIYENSEQKRGNNMDIAYLMNVELDLELLDIPIEAFKRYEKEEKPVFSSFEFILYQGLANGAQPWELVNNFKQNLTEAVNADPAAFWKVFREFNLDRVIPFFSRMSEEQKKSLSELLILWDEKTSTDGVKFFCSALSQVSALDNNELTDFQQWQKTIQLLPGLEDHLNKAEPTETKQKPEYYMQVALAFSYLARDYHLKLRLKPDPIGAVMTDAEGKIIAAGFNLPTDVPDEFIHAEEIVIKKARAQTDDPKLTGCNMYIPVEPCPECGPKIRKLQLDHLFIGQPTLMGGETQLKALDNETGIITSQGILSSSFLQLQGDPYSRAPNIIWEVLGDECKKLIEYGASWKNFLRA